MVLWWDKWSTFSGEQCVWSVTGLDCCPYTFRLGLPKKSYCSWQGPEISGSRWERDKICFCGPWAAVSCTSDGFIKEERAGKSCQHANYPNHLTPLVTPHVGKVKQRAEVSPLHAYRRETCRNTAGLCRHFSAGRPPKPQQDCLC